jgi:hypothetical protein
VASNGSRTAAGWPTRFCDAAACRCGERGLVNGTDAGQERARRSGDGRAARRKRCGHPPGWASDVDFVPAGSTYLHDAAVGAGLLGREHHDQGGGGALDLPGRLHRGR